MKSNKWKFLLTGVATLTLLTACTQASSQSATKSNTAPVSYTHLDVYKRQHKSFIYRKSLFEKEAHKDRQKS